MSWKTRTVGPGGAIRLDGARFTHPTLAPYTGQTVIIHQDEPGLPPFDVYTCHWPGGTRARPTIGHLIVAGMDWEHADA